MKHKRSGKYVYKLHSKDIRKAKYNVSLPLSEAMRNNQEAIITLGDSQIMRFIDSLNGDLENDNKTRRIKSEIKYLRGIKTTNSTKAKLQVLYDELYNLQFCKDYICVVMDSNKDYDLLNKNGFSVNGIEYTRLLGTNGGIKQSTIVYVSKRLYDDLKTKIDNGRNKEIKLVPAKLEAYQALVCSGSVPVPKPRGIIVVGDCITHFKDDVIVLDDSNGGEPTLSYVDDYEVEHNNSDGFGLMMPEYAILVNKDLTGNDTVLSGFNSRYAWNKGMVYAFDFVDFAEKVANTYEIIDAWGDKRDVRDADVILTTSMLKLWDSYDSWEDYYQNCEKNGYEFSATKTTPEELEHVHTLNYQFLQSYDLTDDELRELVQPTIDNLKDVIGMDYRKSLLFLSGMGLNKDSAISSFEDGNCDFVTKALMLNPQMIQDPYIIKRIKSMANKKINDAKKGVIAVEANYAMVGGDPFALCQSMFGSAVTGLLKSGELYHRYFIDKGADELVCFRAPMTNSNNIRKLRLNKSIECAYWFRFIKTAVIINAWDTTCDALNGSDFDGDTFLCTDNPILLAKTKNDKTIMCIQRKAEKVIPTEEDIIASNKIAFNDEIGVITNRVTSMFDVLAGIEKDSEEYRILQYRIMCGQLYQQNSVDACKGIIASKMPKSWYDRHVCKDPIVADRKPYFMIYVYPNLKNDYDDFVKKSNTKAKIMFGKSVDKIIKDGAKNEDEAEFLQYFYNLMPVGYHDCVVNRVAWIVEDAFRNYVEYVKQDLDFDYSILKSGVGYSNVKYKAIEKLYNEFTFAMRQAQGKQKTIRIDDTEQRSILLENFKRDCILTVPNAKELCDIVLDLCYTKETSKMFAWQICGDVIIDNLMEKANNISFPVRDDDEAEFEYMGYGFRMEQF